MRNTNQLNTTTKNLFPESFTAPTTKNIWRDQLIRRTSGDRLDQAAINVGDIVYLKPVDGPAFRSRVIFNTPIAGQTTYTSETVGHPRIRARFHHADVHALESAHELRS
ncbi:hypothetical protein RBI13_07315 [Alcaligenaceae bacterium A4P071]|nr:hypothetical protein [Alcaligenaceae bacterium A4P071]